MENYSGFDVVYFWEIRTDDRYKLQNNILLCIGCFYSILVIQTTL